MQGNECRLKDIAVETILRMNPMGDSPVEFKSHTQKRGVCLFKATVSK